MSPLLRVEGLGKQYGHRWVLKDVGFEIGAGEAVALVGANGSGKTTLLRILATLSKASEGRFLLDAGDPETVEEGFRIRRRIGYLAHRPLVYDDLTGEENLRFVARMAGMPKGEVEDGVRQWLARFGLAGRKADRAGTYSQGMKQRLALARALITKPSLLLLDEPFANLDETATKTLEATLAELQGNAATLLSSHQPRPGWSGRVLRLEDGRLAERAA